ncbi:MAG: efflux RND transporter periplasmic adaptor subunit [Pseudomonadota bacterium]
MRFRYCQTVFAAISVIAIIAFAGGSAGYQAAAASRQMEFDCLIVPNADIQLGSPVAGIVSEMLVDRGDRVRKGQIVAKLESSIQQANVKIMEARVDQNSSLNLAKSKLEFERRRLKRNNKLIESNVLTAQEADEVKTAEKLAYWQVQVAESAAVQSQLELDRTRAELALRQIRSPVDGLVMQRNLEVGEAATGQHLLTIVQLDPLSVESFVPAHIVQQISAGDTAMVSTLSGSSESPMRAIVDVIDPVADAASGLLRVRLKVGNADYKILAGLKCSVAFPSLGQ